jgi:uncharacterized damage-inducible protein DinB
MARIADSLLQELEHEAATTKRVLERVPEDKLDWQPHEKSMTLGRLAHHVATTPGDIAGIAAVDEFDFGTFAGSEQSKTSSELLAAHEASIQKAKDFLGAMDDASAMATWKATMAGRPLMSIPRVGVVRNIMLNHWIHHRGQLSVYLRLLNVPVPSIYGPSADENPFG